MLSRFSGLRASLVTTTKMALTTSTRTARHYSSWTRRRVPGLNSPLLQRLSDSISNHTDVVMGVVAGGLIATTGGIFYYMHQRGRLQQILSKTDWVKLERAEQKGGSWSLPLPVITFVCWAILGVVTAIYSRTKANIDINFRQFASRVNYSLNSLSDGRLYFRTIQEKSLDSVLLGNSAAISLVKQAIKKVSDKDPFLRFPPNYNFFMMNSILNDLSSLSAIGFFQADR